MAQPVKKPIYIPIHVKDVLVSERPILGVSRFKDRISVPLFAELLDKEPGTIDIKRLEKMKIKDPARIAPPAAYFRTNKIWLVILFIFQKLKAIGRPSKISCLTHVKVKG
jgi:hypothetical protein